MVWGQALVVRPRIASTASIPCETLLGRIGSQKGHREISLAAISGDNARGCQGAPLAPQDPGGGWDPLVTTLQVRRSLWFGAERPNSTPRPADRQRRQEGRFDVTAGGRWLWARPEIDPPNERRLSGSDLRRSGELAMVFGQRLRRNWLHHPPSQLPGIMRGILARQRTVDITLLI